jgi:hypothetical protein
MRLALGVQPFRQRQNDPLFSTELHKLGLKNHDLALGWKP